MHVADWPQVSLLTSLTEAARDRPDAGVIEDTPPDLITRPRPESVELSDRPAISDQ